jgi:DTW domain-containing protein YfiP
MTQPLITKRIACPTCQRPQRTCICQWIVPTEHLAEVLILQHPMEVNHAKGSARLLHLSLPHSRIVVAEVFSEQALEALLYAPFGQQLFRQPVLLYPDTLENKGAGISAPPSFNSDLLHDPAQLRLVVLDGTWRKSRKMLFLNPLLQRLPRLPLRNTPTSQYRIRKAHRQDQLSTLEATCYALMQLENEREKYQPLINAFDGFVTQQSQYPTLGDQDGFSL